MAVCVCCALSRTAFSTGRGPFASEKSQVPHAVSATGERSHRGEVKMGVVKEKSETSIIMDEDEFNRSIEPILSKKEKIYFAPPDRDPHFINAHLKVQ